jgi:O-antigen/teichoic acid export membrane protein
MQVAVRILANTPVWVFALLAYLVWQGWQSLQSRTQPIWRMLIVPLVFFMMGVSRLVTARDNGWEPLLAWFVAALLFAALAFSHGPRLLAVDQKNGQVTRPGSVTPLVRNLTVFVLQYGVAVATAMKLEPHAAVAIIGHAVSGASAGYFSGWAAALLRRYVRDA